MQYATKEDIKPGALLMSTYGCTMPKLSQDDLSMLQKALDGYLELLRPEDEDTLAVSCWNSLKAQLDAITTTIKELNDQQSL